MSSRGKFGNADKMNRLRGDVLMNVILDEVELKYLDRPDLPDLAKTFRTKYSEMLSDTKHYRLLRSTSTAP
jgi:hypothetical protein